jgi:hypothetical protein
LPNQGDTATCENNPVDWEQDFSHLAQKAFNNAGEVTLETPYMMNQSQKIRIIELNSNSIIREAEQEETYDASEPLPL